MAVMTEKMAGMAGAQNAAQGGPQMAQGLNAGQAVQGVGGAAPMQGIGGGAQGLGGGMPGSGGMQGLQGQGGGAVQTLVQDMQEVARQEQATGGQVISQETKMLAGMCLQMAGMGGDQMNQQGNAMMGQAGNVLGIQQK